METSLRKATAPQMPTPLRSDVDASRREALSQALGSRPCAVKADAHDLISSPQYPSDRIRWDSQLPGFGLRTRKTGHQTWVAQWRYRGHTRRITIGTADALAIGEARARAREYLEHQSVMTGHQEKPPRLETFVDVFLNDCQHRWKPQTLSAHAYCLHSVIGRHFGRKRIDRISRDDVKRWHESRRGCNRSLSVFLSLMHHAEVMGLRPIGTNPCTNIPRKKSAFAAHKPTEADYRRLGAALNALPDQYRNEVALIRLLALTGMRRGEAIALRWCDIERARAILPDSKTGPKTPLLCSAARTLLDAHRVHSSSSYVFGYGDCPTSIAKVDQAWRAARRWLTKNHPHATA